MKTKFLKVSLLILAFSLVLGAAVATVISANETETTQLPEIISQNVNYNQKFSLMYAVKKTSVADPANLKLNIYDKDPADPEAKLLRTYTEYKEEAASSNNNLPADSYIFTTDGVAATAFLEEIFVQATCGTAKSAVKRYSVAEYLYQRIGDEDSSEAQIKFYQSTINFGANAQIIVDKEENTNALITNYRYVTVDGGTIEGYKTGVYPIGAELNVVKDNAENPEQWRHFYYDEIGMPKNTKTDSTFTVQDSPKNTLVLYDIDAKRLGAEDFSGFTASTLVSIGSKSNSADGLIRNQNGTVKYAYINDETRGMIGHVDLTTSGGIVSVNKNNTVFSAAEATAFECSFDIKVDMTFTGSDDCLRPYFYNNNDQQCSNTNWLHFRTLNEGTNEYETNALYLMNRTQKVADIDTTDWFHIRFVVYKGDNRIFMYVNHSDEYVTYYSLNSTYSGDITDLGGFGFQQYGHASNIYLDNVFCGFTKEVNPDPK